jgi:hypothetical protein
MHALSAPLPPRFVLPQLVDMVGRVHATDVLQLQSNLQCYATLFFDMYQENKYNSETDFNNVTVVIDVLRFFINPLDNASEIVIELAALLTYFCLVLGETTDINFGSLLIDFSRVFNTPIATSVINLCLQITISDYSYSQIIRRFLFDFP